MSCRTPRSQSSIVNRLAPTPKKNHQWINKFEPITSFSLSYISIILFFFLPHLCHPCFHLLLDNTPIFFSWWLSQISKWDRKRMASIATFNSSEIFCINFLSNKNTSGQDRPMKAKQWKGKFLTSSTKCLFVDEISRHNIFSLKISFFFFLMAL